MRKALFVLGCLACILLVADIGLTVAANRMATGAVTSIGDKWSERLGQGR